MSRTIEKEIDYGKLIESLFDTHRKGENLIIDTCPYCGEKSTMAFSTRFYVAKCFRCGRATSAVELVMKVKNLGFKEAEKYMLNFIKK